MTPYPDSMVDLTGTGPNAVLHDECELAYRCTEGGHYFVNQSGPANWCSMHNWFGKSTSDCVCGQVEVLE